jgi:hypothetical protein
MATSKTEQIISVLKAKGSIEIESKSRKYRTFTYPGTQEKFYFVGKSAALRVGRTSSDSISLEMLVPRLLYARSVDKVVIVIMNHAL